MLLWQFRKHLADELRSFPEELSPATESYAVVTATLARAMLTYLHVSDLTLPNGLDPKRSKYDLLKVLNRIIHFSGFGQDTLALGKPNLIMVYSDRSLLYRDRMYFRLADYIDLMNRLATDDLFVSPYLLKRTITAMRHLMAIPIPKGNRGVSHKVGQLRRLNTDLISESWEMVLALLQAGKIEIQPSQIECYEELFERGVEVFAGYQTTQELVAGYRKTWSWTWFNTYTQEIAGCETYCVPVDEINGRENGRNLPLVVPFSVFIDIFDDVQNQLRP